MLKTIINQSQINEVNKFVQSAIGYPLCVMMANDDIVISFISKDDNRMNFYYICSDGSTYVDIFNKYEYRNLDMVVDFNEFILNVYPEVNHFYSFIGNCINNEINMSEYSKVNDFSKAINAWINNDVVPYLDQHDIDCIKQCNNNKYIIDVVQYVHDLTMEDKFKFTRFNNLSRVLMTTIQEYCIDNKIKEYFLEVSIFDYRKDSVYGYNKVVAKVCDDIGDLDKIKVTFRTYRGKCKIETKTKNSEYLYAKEFV